MSYGLLLEYEVTTPTGIHRLEIHKRDYNGNPIEVNSIIKDSLVLNMDVDDVNAPIRISTLSFSLPQNIAGFNYSQFFTPDSTLFKVIWQTQVIIYIPPHGELTTWQDRWSGYLVTDFYKEPLQYRGSISLTARDSLGRLKELPFDFEAEQYVYLGDLIYTGLEKADVLMDFDWQSHKYANFPDSETDIADACICTTKFTEEEDITWWDVIEMTLKGVGCTLRWFDKNRICVRDISGYDEDFMGAYFVDKSGYREIQTAWKSLKVTQDYGKRDSFYDGQLKEVDCGYGSHYFYPNTECRWQVEGGSMHLANPFYVPSGDTSGFTLCDKPEETLMLPIIASDNTNVAMVWQIDMPAVQGGFEISMNLSNALWREGLYCEAQGEVILGQKVSYEITYRMDVFFVYNGVTYILREKWENYNTWRSQHSDDKYISRTTSCPIDDDKQPSIQEEDMTITAATTPGAGRLIFKLYNPVAKTTVGDLYISSTAALFTRISNIEMTLQGDGSDYTKTIAINNAFNVREELSLEVGQIPVNAGNALKYLGGLLADDIYHTPLGSFGHSLFNEGYDLLDLVAKEYIMRRNAAYNVLSGTLMSNSLFYFNKAIDIYDGSAYQVINASLRIISNTLEVNTMIEECTFPEDDTISFTNPNSFAVTVTIDGESGSLSVPAKESASWPTAFEAGDELTWRASGGSGAGTRSGSVTISGYTNINVGYIEPQRYAINFLHSNNDDVTVTISGAINTSFVVIHGYTTTIYLTKGKSINWSASAVGYTTRMGSVNNIQAIQNVNVTLQQVVIRNTDVNVRLTLTPLVPEPYVDAEFTYLISTGGGGTIDISNTQTSVISNVRVGATISWSCTYPTMDDKSGEYVVPATGAEIEVRF